MMRFRHLLATLALIPGPAFAGAWLQPEGTGMAIMQFNHFGSSEYWDSDGDTNDQLFYSKWEFQPYLEYGLTSKLTVGATAGLQDVEQGGNHNTGIADPELFVRFRLWCEGSQVLSLQPLIKLPSHFRESGTPRGGSRSFDQEISLLYGANVVVLSPFDFINLQAGYRERGRGLGSQTRAEATLGMWLDDGKHWRITPSIRGIYGENSTEAAVFSENGEQDYSLLKLDASLEYHINEKQWVSLTLSDHVAGYNTGNGTGIALSYGWGF